MGLLAKDVASATSDLMTESLPAGSNEAFDALPVAVYVCDSQGLILQYNRAAAELWGCTPKLRDPADRYCGSFRLFRLDGGPLAHAECAMADVLRTGAPARSQEIIVERPDGSRAVALADIEPIKDRAGRVIGAVNCLQDITERRREQTELRALERRWRELLQALPAAVYTTDAAGRITFYNEAAAELWGYRPQLERTEWCGSWRLRWPDGRPMPHDECAMAQAIKEGRALRGMEAIAERPNGERVPFLAYPTPLRDENGALTGAVNMLIDIREQKLADKTAALLAAIVESSDDAIISKDLNSIITSWNRGAELVYGYAAEEAIGRPVTIIIPEDRREEEQTILARINRGERVDHFETVRQRKDGERIDISLTVSPIKNSEGRIVGASKIARDVTERRRAQERQKLLLREMNHRVKNLFALTSGLVTLSASAAATPTEMAEALRQRLGALAIAHDLTLPDLARGGSEIEEATTLGALVRAILSPYAEPRRGADGGVVVRGPTVRISGAAVTNLALLLHELATNAAKYGALSSPQGRVEVDWASSGDQLALIWRETGGPPVEGPPTSEGFGSFVARGAVEVQFGGRVTRDWKREGLVVRLVIPLARLGR